MKLYLWYFQPFPVEGQEAPLFYFLKKEGVLIQLSRHQNIFQFIEGLAAARLMEARDNVENSLPIW